MKSTASAASTASPCIMDQEDSRAAEDASAPSLEPFVARDLHRHRLHPQIRRWSGTGLSMPQEPHYAESNTGLGSNDHDVLTPPLHFSANSAGAFIPSIVDAPAYEDDEFAQLSAAIKKKSEKLVAGENERDRAAEQLAPQSYNASKNTGITSSSSSSPPPTRFHLPLITAVPQSDSVPQAGFDWAGGSAKPSDSPSENSTMLFTEFGRSAATRRRMASSSALTEYEADLTSKDRLKQKDAIRRLLAGKVKDDWQWTWPSDDRPITPVFERPAGDSAEPDWQEREDWESNAGDSDDEADGGREKDAAIIGDPFRFDNPDTVGPTIVRKIVDRKTRRRRRLQQEMLINDGVACFTHRRNAWTRARHVRIPRSTNATPISPSSNPDITPVGDTIDDEDGWEYITEIPIASPILPPETPMRKGISEKAYVTIYDKVITQSQTPYCPINLSVVVRSCVEGWKRDGEWPPKGEAIPGKVLKGASMGSEAKRALLFAKRGTKIEAAAGEAGTKDKGIVRRSLQRVLGVVHGRRNSEIVTANTVAAVYDDGDANGIGSTNGKAKEEGAAGDVPVVAPIL